MEMNNAERKINEIKADILSPKKGKSAREVFYTVLRILVAMLLLVLLSVSIDLSKIIYSLKKADYLYISLALVLLVPNLYFQYAKWEVICFKVLNEKKKISIFLSLFYGISAGAITPMRLGEYVGRRIALKNSSIVSVTAATMADKLFLMVITYIFGFLSCLIFMRVYWHIGYASFILLLSAFAAAFFFFLLLVYFPGGLFNKIMDILKKIIPSRFLAGNNISEALSILKGLNRSARIRISIYSLLMYLVMLLQYSCLVSAFAHNWDLFVYMLAGNLMILSKTLLPFSFGDLGIRESASVFFLLSMGVSAVVGFNASIFLFLINIFIPSVFGSILLIKGGK